MSHTDDEVTHLILCFCLLFTFAPQKTFHRFHTPLPVGVNGVHSQLSANINLTLFFYQVQRYFLIISIHFSELKTFVSYNSATFDRNDVIFDLKLPEDHVTLKNPAIVLIVQYPFLIEFLKFYLF